MIDDNFSMLDVGSYPLWELDIEEVAGHNLEVKGREEVNKMLSQGWILLHIYTLKYQEDGIWRERPMAILGKPKEAHINKSGKITKYL